jgi:hypothetical protein
MQERGIRVYRVLFINFPWMLSCFCSFSGSLIKSVRQQESFSPGALMKAQWPLGSFAAGWEGGQGGI